MSLAYFSFLASTGQVSGFFLASTFIIAVMGYFDDLLSRPALDKMLVQIFCVVCVVLFDPTLQQTVSKAYGPWGTFWSIFFILGLMNAINFIDGIDGLAGIVLFFGGLGLVLFSLGDSSLQNISVYGGILMGMLIPFLYLNVGHRKGFLGNVGSYTLSYILAVQHLQIPMETSNIISRLAIPSLCFLIPIADASMVLVHRLSTRRSPFQADKGHLHHRLLQASLPLRSILLVMGLIELMGVLVAFVMNKALGSIPSWLAPVICFSQAVTVAMLIVLIEKTSKKRVQGYFSHLDQGKSVFYLKYRLSNQKGAPLARHQMNRLEARINAAIRITDMCFIQGTDTLFVTLRNPAERFKGVSARIDRIFEEERVQYALSLEQGEFVKISQTAHASQTLHSVVN
jgi:UDP-GlcNAc:undecaprenyl-phosphate GlcNAc-1-phosphate transferase